MLDSRLRRPATSSCRHAGSVCWPVEPGTPIGSPPRGPRRSGPRGLWSASRWPWAVPGRPNQRPTRAMITLSTCATPERQARGNYWAGEFGKPEHRIDKIRVLVAARPERR